MAGIPASPVLSRKLLSEESKQVSVHAWANFPKRLCSVHRESSRGVGPVGSCWFRLLWRQLLPYEDPRKSWP